MSETLAVIITLAVTILIQILKPEWIIGWLLNILNSKLKNKEQANQIENNLGYKFGETAVYILKKNPDKPSITEATQEMETALKKIEDELKNVL